MIFRLQPSGSVVEVEAGSAALAHEVGRLFAPLQVSERGGHGGAKLAVRLEGGAYALVASDEGCPPERFGTLPELMGATEHAILSRLLTGARTTTQLHAAGLALPRGAVLAVGPSGAGKSSLAWAWSRGGRPILSDDAVLVAPDGRVRGVPRLVKLDRARLADSGVEAEGTVAHDPLDPEVWVDPSAWGGWAVEPLPVAVIAQVRYDGGAGTRVDALSRGEALRLLVDHLLDGGLGPEASFERLAGVAAAAPAFRVAFGDATDAAARLAELQ